MKIYKVIWSKARGCYIVVSELAKSTSKSCSSKKLVAVLVAVGVFGFNGVVNAAIYGRTTGVGEGCITVINGNETNRTLATEIGYSADASAADYATAIGTFAKASSEYAIALGVKAQATGKSAIAIGSYDGSITQCTVAEGLDSIAIGNNAIATQSFTMALGNVAKAIGERATAIGDSSQASGEKSTALGHWAVASGINSTTVGANATASNESATALGYNTKASGEKSTALGISAAASGTDSTALGNTAQATGVSSIALGDNARAINTSATAMGSSSIAGGNNATALGSDAQAAGISSIALGADAYAENVSAIAIGTSAKANAEDSIALGSNSVANTSAGAVGYLSNYKSSTQDASVWTSTAGAVSIGGTINNVTNTRQITNLAAGTQDTDAVNVAQLKAVESQITSIGYVDASTNVLKIDKLTTINGGLNVNGTVNLNGKLEVNDNSTTINNNLNVKNRLVVEDDKTTVKTNFIVIDSSENAVLNVTDNSTTINNALVVNNGVTINNGLTISTGDLVVNNSITANNITAIGVLSANSLNINNNEFYVDNSGNTTINGTLNVNNNALIVDNSRNTTINGILNVNNINAIGNFGLTVNDNSVLNVTKNSVTNNNDVTINASGTLNFNIGGNNVINVTDNSTTINNDTTINGTLNVNNNRITNIANGVELNDAVNMLQLSQVQLYQVLIGQELESKVYITMDGLNLDQPTTVKNNLTVNEGDFTVKNELGDVSFQVTKAGDTIIKNGDTSLEVKSEGSTFKNNVNINGTLDMGGNKITNIKDGDISPSSSDAVTGRQIYNIQNDFNQQIGEVNSKVDRVGARSAALAALHPLDFDPDNKLTFAAGYGNYQGASAGALGAFYRPDEKVMFSVSGTMANQDNMFNVGVSFALDRTPHVTNSKTAMAREILELREHVAKQDAQIAQLVDLVNKLAGKQQMLQDMETTLFPDVPENHWAYEYIAELQRKGIIIGYPDGNYDGERRGTRYEFAAMLYRALRAGEQVPPRLLEEFKNELCRFRVDRVAGEDNSPRKIERIRVNNDFNYGRDAYGSKNPQPVTSRGPQYPASDRTK